MCITVRRSSAANSQSLEMFDAAQPPLGPTAAAEIEGGLDEGWGHQTLGPADFHRALLPGGSLGVDVSGGLLFVESRPTIHVPHPSLELGLRPSPRGCIRSGYRGNPCVFYTQRPAGESGAQRRPS